MLHFFYVLLYLISKMSLRKKFKKILQGLNRFKTSSEKKIKKGLVLKIMINKH